MNLILWIFFLIGHIGVWCIVFNRVHATSLPRPIRKLSEKIVILAVLIPLICLAVYAIRFFELNYLLFYKYTAVWFYLLFASVSGVVLMLQWLWRKLTFRLPNCVVSSERTIIDIGKEVGWPFRGTFAKLLGSIPFNEASVLSLQKMTFRLPVPPDLDGLKICQLSDLHFTGHIAVEYFEQLIKRANEFEPDLVIITGDIVDAAECLDWLETTLGRLKAKHDIYYVFGNHDLRIKDEAGYRKRLEKLGLIAAAGQWRECKIGNATIQLTGNSLPWYPQAKSLLGAPEEKGDLRILLSHSPDQIEWAKPFQFDMMFAGHTHGGQIALPVIGPLVAPSKYGVQFASGTFQVDQMVMHVSRGISGDRPIRICSPPELGLFTIVAE